MLDPGDSEEADNDEPTDSSSRPNVPAPADNSSCPNVPAPNEPAADDFSPNWPPPSPSTWFPQSVSRLLLLNGRSVCPAAGNSSKWKLPFIQTTLLDNNKSPPVFVLGITETWFNDATSDAQVELKNYNCIRSDREGRRGGGCALYVHSKIVPSDQLVVGDPYNNLTAIYIESLHTIVAIVYRPPDSPDEDFSKTMDKLQEMIEAHSTDERTPDIYLSGDFNLPLFNWDQCALPAKPPTAAYSRLMTMIEKNFFTQLVTQPTRGNNTLDLVLTNSPRYVIEVCTENTTISDHALVDCMLSFNPTASADAPSLPPEPHSFRAINYHQADFEAMNRDLGEVNWYLLRELCIKDGDPDGSLYNFKQIIVLTVLQIALKHSPQKFKATRLNKSRLDRELTSLKMKRRKLNRKATSLRQINPSSSMIKKLETEADLKSYEIRDVIISQLNEKEDRAVNTIKTNPKFFYSYAKRLAKCKSTIAPLRNQEGILTDNPREKAELLQNQYIGVFSDPDKADIIASVQNICPRSTEDTKNGRF